MAEGGTTAEAFGELEREVRNLARLVWAGLRPPLDRLVEWLSQLGRPSDG